MIFQSMYNPIKAEAVPETVQHPDGSIQLPTLEYPEPGFFDGIGDTWKSVFHGAYTGASSLITAASQIPLENFTTQPEVREWVREQREQVMPANARELRRIAKDEYELDPMTSGIASQIVFGLGDVLPKAALYGMAGPSAGAVMLGADLGIQRANELMDEGVDEKTAAAAGVFSFAAGAIGMKLPAAFETATRLRSGLIGAGANAGLSAAEVMGIHWTLEEQDYDALAEKYQLNAVDVAISAAMGGAFGVGLWHPSADVRYARARDDLQKRFSTSLRATGRFDDAQVEAQARLNATAVVSAARRMNVAPEKIVEFAPRVEVSQDASADAFNMPTTQGIEWHMGPKPLAPETSFDVLSFPNRRLSAEEIKKQRSSIDTIFRNGVKNDDSGFVLMAGRSDVGKWFQSKRNAWFLNEVGADGLERLAESARLLESHVDVKHRNPDVQGIHKFVNAASVGDQTMRVVFTVRDYAIKNQERTVIRLIDSVDIDVVEGAPSTVPSGLAGAEGALPSESQKLPSSARPVEPHSLHQEGSHTVTLSQLLGGKFPLTRADQKDFFAPIDESQYQAGGVYYEAPELNQIAGNAENRGSFSPSENRITLTPNADITTFSHEIGHWYLNTLLHASMIGGVDQSVRADTNAVLASFGIESVDAWDRLGIEGQRKYHERFAAWVEQYLSTGQAPSPTLASLFRRFGEWIKDLFAGMKGTPADQVAARYKAEFGENLPQLSSEVRKVIERMYRDDFGKTGRKPSKDEVAAARVIQAQENDRRRKTAIVETARSDDADIYEKVSAAQRKAASDINAGRPVNVAHEVEGVPFSDQRIGAAKRKVAREIFTGDGSTSVVLQNRDRSTAVSVGQMLSIAKNPIYGLLGFDRKTSSGAPLVAFGEFPPDAQIGIADYVVDDSGDQVPVVYAVVEADSVLTSNRIDGVQIEDYGNPARMNVVAGNGRMTALQESYRRGQADGYRKAMTADRMHGVDPAVIEQMRAPVLVRIMPQEKVTTGFVKRSNADHVMARSPVEIALEDAPKIRENISTYRFDESGKPSEETVRQFTVDIGEPNALARMFNSDGDVTPEAESRIRAAAFQEAYRNERLTELFTSVTDPGIKRILNAMSVMAPRVVEIRNATSGLIDLGPGMVDAANSIAQARSEGVNLQDLIRQTSFLDSPTAGPFLDLFGRNANSSIGISHVLLPLADWIDERLSTRGGLFGDDKAVDVDIAGVLGEMRRLENAQRIEAGLDPLPDVDESAIRAGVQHDIESIQQALRQVDETTAPAKTAQSQPEAAGTVKPELVLEESAGQQLDFGLEDAPAAPHAAEQTEAPSRPDDPIDLEFEQARQDATDQTFYIEDEDGTLIEMTADQIDERARQIEQDAQTKGRGIVEAGLCIIQNQGIQ